VVFNSWSDFPQSSLRFAISFCCSQPSQIQRQCQCFRLLSCWWIEHTHLPWCPLTCLEFNLYPRLLYSHGGIDSSHKLEISIFLQQLCTYAWLYELPSILFICLSSQSSPCTKLPLMVEFFPCNVDLESSDLYLLCRSGIIFPKSYLEFSCPKPCLFTAWASHSNVVC
jgi:hypothetical protein